MATNKTKIISTIECYSAEELLDSLSPRGKYFRSVEPGESWIFRGHGNEVYPLLPSSYRSEKTSRHLRGRDLLGQIAGFSTQEMQDVSVLKQAYLEAFAIKEFFLIADSNGLSIPEDSQDRRERFKKLFGHLEATLLLGNDADENEKISWPTKDLVPWLALARHHGIPTCVLDWSRSSFIAAFFAAKDAAMLSREGTEGSLCVWAFNHHDYEVLGWNPEFPDDLEIQVHSVSRATNPYLHAQDGIFTVNFILGKQIRNNVNDLMVDGIVSELARGWSKDLGFDGGWKNILYKFTLPWAESRDLLWLLAKEGINSARLFPGYDGVAEALKERHLWRNANVRFGGLPF